MKLVYSFLLLAVASSCSQPSTNPSANLAAASVKDDAETAQDLKEIEELAGDEVGNGSTSLTTYSPSKLNIGLK